MKKRVLMAIMCMMLGLGCGSNAMAATLEQATDTGKAGVVYEIQPRAAECGNCGKYFFSATNVTYGSWADTGIRDCPKYRDRKDMVQTRQVYTTYKCRHCGYTRTVTSSESRVQCNH